MNEKEAREPMSDELDRLKAQKDEIVRIGAKKIFDEGYLAGIEAERERVKPLVEAVEHSLAEVIRCTRMPGTNDSLCHRNCWRCNLEDARAAYTTPQNDGQRDSGEHSCAEIGCPRCGND